jgi:hypothetical protein
MLFGLVDISWREMQWNQTPSSNLNHEACYPEFLVVFSVPQANVMIVLKITLLQLLPNHHSPIILPFNTMQPKKLTASFKQQTKKQQAKGGSLK